MVGQGFAYSALHCSFLNWLLGSCIYILGTLDVPAERAVVGLSGCIGPCTWLFGCPTT